MRDPSPEVKDQLFSEAPYVYHKLIMMAAAALRVFGCPELAKIIFEPTNVSSQTYGLIIRRCIEGMDLMSLSESQRSLAV